MVGNFPAEPSTDACFSVGSTCLVNQRAWSPTFFRWFVVVAASSQAQEQAAHTHCITVRKAYAYAYALGGGVRTLTYSVRRAVSLQCGLGTVMTVAPLATRVSVGRSLGPTVR